MSDEHLTDILRRTRTHEDSWPADLAAAVMASDWLKSQLAVERADLAAELRRHLSLYRQTQGINSENVKGWEACVRDAERIVEEET